MTEEEQLKIYARFQLYKFESLRKYGQRLTTLRRAIVGMIAAGASAAAITQYINEKMQEEGLEHGDTLQEELITVALLYAAIYGLSGLDFKLSNPVFGHGYKEQVRISRGNITRALQGIAREHYSKGLHSQDTNSRLKRIIKTTTNVTGLSWALGRLDDLIEQVDVAVDRTVNGLTGWQSVAILDSKTTPVCVSLHRVFYPIKTYKRRSQVPNRPPRHRRCRSKIIRVYGEPLEFSLDTFLKNNQGFARDFMGDKKFELWRTSQLSVSKFTDLAGNRLFTNKELMTKYNLEPES